MSPTNMIFAIRWKSQWNFNINIVRFLLDIIIFYDDQYVYFITKISSPHLLHAHIADMLPTKVTR